MDKTLLERYGAPVPRYTSYPTAPHFQPEIGAESYRAWLGGIGAQDTLSLYFHVPFCAAMCWYCGCHTKIVKRYRPIAGYAGQLGQEMALVAKEVTAAAVVHVHWGGGTPTMLSKKDFSSLMEDLRGHFRFADDAEVAVEIDPRTLTADMAKALAGAGVTRASLGVQDFNEHVQEAVNRIQPFDVTARAVGWLRGAGIDAINFDLMYGLPHQSVDDVLCSVDLAHRLAPDRLAVFGYAHVPWMKAHQRMIETDALPDGGQRMAQAEAAAGRLVEHGYRAIGLDHFARAGDALATALDEGRLRRNFQGYTTDRATALLGFGASAIGSLAQGYVQNAVSFGDYARAIGSGRLAVARGIRLMADDRLRRAIIESLMCGLEVDVGAVAARFGLPDRFQTEFDALAPMAEDGLVDISDRHIGVTPKGRPWIRTIAAQFDRYLGAAEARHSHAV